MTAPRGIRNHNPGNIRRLPGVRWQGTECPQTDPEFVTFEAPKWGIRALCRVLITYQDKRQAQGGGRIDTIREIIERWAPAVENDTVTYIEHVSGLTGLGADDTVDVYDWHTMRRLALAIIRHENGCQPYDDATIDAGLILAGLQPPASEARRESVKDTAIAAVGSVATAGAAIIPAVVESLPAAKATFEQVRDATAFTAELWVGLPLFLASLAVVAFLILRARKARLELVAGRQAKGEAPALPAALPSEGASA